MFRTLTSFATLATVLVGAPMPAKGQADYPNRVVKIVVPYGAGSVPDVLARALASTMSSRLNQQFIIENKIGASGALGTMSVARADADGYTLLFAPALVLSVLPQTRGINAGYKSDALIPVCQTFVNTMGLVVRPDLPISSVVDLVTQPSSGPTH